VRNLLLALDRTKFAIVMSFLLVCSSCAPTQQPNTASVAANQAKRTARIYLDLRGEPNLVHRFRTYVEFDFEDAGLIIVSAEAQADAVVHAKFESENETVEIATGVVRMSISSNGKEEQLISCATTNSDAKGELFEKAASSALADLRRKYSAAHTVRLDSSSDMSQSTVFSDELPGALKSSGFNIAESDPNAILLRLDLQRQKARVEENILKYDTSVSVVGESIPLTSKGSGVRSARLVGDLPEKCSSGVSDLDWLAGEDPLFRQARFLTRNIQKQTMKPAASN
jgi:hypothetical protein